MEQHIPGIVLKDGLTQPVFDYKRCLFEKVYVETPVDTDGDGRLDLIAVYIRRPLETTQGMRVPAIYVPTPTCWSVMRIGMSPTMWTGM